MEEQKPTEGQASISRRNFLAIGTLSIGGVIGVGIGLPSLVYLVGPSLQANAVQEWIRIGSASKVEIGVPTLYKVKTERRVGWNVTEEELAVYVLTENGSDFTAVSNICTHLGCRVRWIDGKDQFFCPCHNAVFAKNGEVVAGPPPKPLEKYPVKVENDQLYILVGG